MSGPNKPPKTESGVRATPLEDDQEFWVFSFPLGGGLPADIEAAASLTPAEREVVLLAKEGLSNAEIAVRRGTVERTVANQLRSIYDKLGVGSRNELSARFDARARAKGQ